PRRFALLVFLLPSLLYWPSSIGKDAWMLLTLGVAALGTAKIVTGRRSGVVALALGIAGMGFVRPHVAAMVLVAVLIAMIPRRAGGASARFGARLAIIAVTLLGGSFLLQEVESFFGLEGDLREARGVLEETEQRTTQGGSSFSAEPVESITDLPNALVTVLFRPFPHEAHNVQSLISSLEGVFLLVLFLAAARRLARAPTAAWREPYLLFTLAYSLLFVVAFSGFGNFGILARQRIQVLPLLLVLLTFPRNHGMPKGEPTDDLPTMPTSRLTLSRT
ncbi:MAG: hypothetical protein M3173_04785, partial [Chloroflexota bacterium]|nr:hypothetical protein [Chloroflexota bacterium]